MPPAGAPQARSVGGWRDRRELALGGDVGRGRVAAVTDRGRRADTKTETETETETETGLARFSHRPPFEWSRQPEKL